MASHLIHYGVETKSQFDTLKSSKFLFNLHEMVKPYGNATLNSADSTGPSSDDNQSSTSSQCLQQDSFTEQHDYYSLSPNSRLKHDFSPILNSALIVKKKTVTDDNKYKTELCKNWIELGTCNYGKKCKFAHGKHELIEKHKNQKSQFRRRKCHTFFTTGMCPYGVRCMFAHEQRTLAEINAEYYYSKFLLFPEFFECESTSNKKRLPIFESLRSFGNDEVEEVRWLKLRK